MAELIYNEQGRLLFTEEMKQEYTLLMPQMLSLIHICGSGTVWTAC